MKTFLLAASALVVMFTFSACNTFTGLGRDIQSAGHGIQRAAQWCTPD